MTFVNYPLYAQVKLIDLAEAGFIYTGKRDEVECVWCHLRLWYFSPGDVPITRHFNECSWGCEFLKGGDVGNVPIVTDPVRRPNPLIPDLGEVCCSHEEQ